MNLDPTLLELLACPQCHGELTVNDAESSLDCAACALRYPVRDGIPDLLIEDAVSTQ